MYLGSDGMSQLVGQYLRGTEDFSKSVEAKLCTIVNSKPKAVALVSSRTLRSVSERHFLHEEDTAENVVVTHTVINVP